LRYKHLSLQEGLPSREARKLAKETRARAILQDAVVIYASSDLAVIGRRLAEFQRRWGPLEALAVRCFVKDFNLTLNYLRVPFPHKRLIRTTNLLERFFREFRTRADGVGCFGSQAQAETLFYELFAEKPSCAGREPSMLSCEECSGAEKGGVCQSSEMDASTTEIEGKIAPL
jgi:transposase-like protein